MSHYLQKNLPAQLTPLLDRQEELAMLCQMIGEPDSGVLVLTLTEVRGTGAWFTESKRLVDKLREA